MTSIVRTMIVVSALSSARLSVHAQTCQPHWLSTGPVAGLDDFRANAATSWDPDGAGPEPALLVAVGGFDVAGNVAAKNIAAFSNATGQWQSFADGFNLVVNAVTVYNGDVITGGSFSNSGGTPVNRIARWNGKSWQPLGAGLGSTVNALTVYNGDLIAGGVFTTAGGQSANRIVRWDGTSWHPLGTGIGGGQVHALTVYKNELIAAGTFTSAGGVSALQVASWDGTNWHGMGSSSFTPGVNALTVHDGELIAAGYFPERVVKWDPGSSSWQIMGDGSINYGKGLISQDGQLYLSTTSSPNGPAGVYAWNGTTWELVGEPMIGGSGTTGLATYQGSLIVVGWFSAAGGAGSSHVARWNGKAWEALNSGLNASVEAFIEFNGQLFAGGHFLTQTGAKGIAVWQNESWQPLTAGGITDPDFGVYTFTAFQNQLIAAGFFEHAGVVSASNIARWDGTAWQALSTGTNSFVNAVAVYNGELIAAGQFTSAGGISVNRIARWNGSSWQTLGTGITVPASPNGIPVVYTLAVHNGELIVGGSFLVAGGVSAANIARWNGTSWQQMGIGLGTVLALIDFNGELIANGGSTHVIRWNGSGWEPFGGVTDVTPGAFATHNGDLISIGSVPPGDGIISGAARWDGSSWSTLGEGFNRSASAGISYNGELIVGGNFSIADGNVSAFWSRLYEPIPGDVTCDGTVNTADLLAVINSWGPCPPPCTADLTGDGVVNVADLLEVINNWG